MHDEMKADIDKNGRRTGAYCSTVQLYDAPFSFRVNAFIFFTIPRGLGTRSKIRQKLFRTFAVFARLC